MPEEKDAQRLVYSLKTQRGTGF